MRLVGVDVGAGHTAEVLRPRLAFRDEPQEPRQVLNVVPAGGELVAGGNESEEPFRQGPERKRDRPEVNEVLAAADVELHACRGLNDCKGQGADKQNACAGQGSCASVKHGCSGQNDCKHQGGCGEAPGMNG